MSHEICMYLCFAVVGLFALDVHGLNALPQETVLQAALMMNTGSLKVLEIGAVTPSQCLRLLKELPHCTRLQKFGIQLTDRQVCVSQKSVIHGSLSVA